MIFYKNEEEIDLIRNSSLLVANTHAEIANLIKPGITTLQLDKIAEEYIRDHGGKPAFKGYQGFPNTLCTSPNEQVVHGIPNNQPVDEGSILSVDCGVLMNGFYGDSAYTYSIGEVDSGVQQLLEVTKACLYKGIDQLMDEGVAQLFTLEINGRKVIGTVGALQYEVIQYRLEHEYGAKCTYENLNVHKACWVEAEDESNEEYKEFKRVKQKFLAKDKHNQLVFFADSMFSLQMTQQKYPSVKLHLTSEF